MEKILECADKLSEILVDSDVYQNYLCVKKDLEPDDIKLLTEFKKLYFEYCNGGKNFENEKVLSSVYSKLMLEEKTRLFLQKELEITECIKNVYSKIAEKLEVEIFS